MPRGLVKVYASKRYDDDSEQTTKLYWICDIVGCNGLISNYDVDVDKKLIMNTARYWAAFMDFPIMDYGRLPEYDHKIIKR